MKSTHSTINEIKSAILGLTLCISTGLLITSCQKEEWQQQQSDTNSSPRSNFNQQAKESPAMAFTSIKIDHIAAMSLLPDYSIIINSNGTAIYEGRRNVRVKGIVELRITDKELWYINSVCMRTSFFQLKGGESNVPDMPSVETTYIIWKRQFTLSDYNGQPEELASFRSKIESALNLSKLINTSTYIAHPKAD